MTVTWRMEDLGSGLQGEQVPAVWPSNLRVSGLQSSCRAEQIKKKCSVDLHSTGRKVVRCSKSHLMLWKYLQFQCCLTVEK